MRHEEIPIEANNRPRNGHWILLSISKILLLYSLHIQNTSYCGNGRLQNRRLDSEFGSRHFTIDTVKEQTQVLLLVHQDASFVSSLHQNMIYLCQYIYSHFIENICS